MSVAETPSNFTPRNADYRARVSASFGRQAAMETLGISLTDVAPGAVEFRLPYADQITQQHGFIHGGVIATALDSACGYAAFSLMPAEATVLTVEFKVNLLAPAKGEFFVVHGRVVKAGKTISVAQGEAFAYQNEGDKNGKLIAQMTATLMAVYGKKEIRD